MKRRKARRLRPPCHHPGRKALAYHEAGHAIVGYALGLQIERLTIVRDGIALGQCAYVGWGADEAAQDPGLHLLLTLAGPVAEEIVTGLPSRAADRDTALRLARLHGAGDGEAGALIASTRGKIERFLECHWPIVKALATALRAGRELDGGQAMATIRRAFRKTAIPAPQAGQLPLVRSLEFSTQREAA